MVQVPFLILSFALRKQFFTSNSFTAALFYQFPSSGDIRDFHAITKFILKVLLIDQFSCYYLIHVESDIDYTGYIARVMDT